MLEDIGTFLAGLGTLIGSVAALIKVLQPHTRKNKKKHK